MHFADPISEFVSAFQASLAEGVFVKLSLDNYVGDEVALQRLYIRKALIQKQEKLSFTYRYATRDVVKNFSVVEGQLLLAGLLQEHFHGATLCTTQYDLRVERHNSGKVTLRKGKPTHAEVLPLEHDRQKKRLIAAQGKPYLQALGITDAAGNVHKNAQDKYRQINKYVEILGGLLAQLPKEKTASVLDMGCGKGYLTFALYDYMANTLGLTPRVTGVDMRADMVELCNSIARDCGFNGLQFAQGAIGQADTRGVTILIALHACDTATDDAIAQGIKAGAELIVVAPCCHKQIRQEMQAHKAQHPLGFLLRHGIFAERQAEMVTDGLRALILESCGYSTKVFEFISDAHTPKNVMIVATRTASAAPNAAALEAIRSAKAFFGIHRHALEKALVAL
jgi:SAM-dependent methyltransferase